MTAKLPAQPSLPIEGCGGSIQFTGRDVMTDGNNHQVLFAHAQPVHNMVNALGLIRELHLPEFEDFVLRCGHDHRVWPCPTIAIMDAFL